MDATQSPTLPEPTIAAQLRALVQQAQAGEISISNRNCALQGLSRTNQTNFFLFASAGDHGEDKPPNVTFDKDCTSEWFTLRVGHTKTLQVASWIRYVGSWATQCRYNVLVH